MLVIPTSSTPLRRRLKEIRNRWHRLIKTVRHPYRPERHYMRGPGPKWHAKYRSSENAAL